MHIQLIYYVFHLLSAEKLHIQLIYTVFHLFKGRIVAHTAVVLQDRGAQVGLVVAATQTTASVKYIEIFKGTVYVNFTKFNLKLNRDHGPDI